MEQFLCGFGYRVKKKDGELHPREIQKVLSEIEGKTEERVITRVVLRSMMQEQVYRRQPRTFWFGCKILLSFYFSNTSVPGFANSSFD